jgi:protein-tyrosine phosphatase
LNILFVCLGNICRSPLAEGITRKRYHELSLKGRVASAGTAYWEEGKKADQRSIKVASLKGIDISNHRARQVSLSDFEDYDLVIAMDENNERDLLRLAPAAYHFKIRRLKDESGNPVSVQDPYYGSERDFLSVFNLLEKCIGLELANL